MKLEDCGCEVEIDSTYKGVRYVVLFQSMGHRCGYIGLTDSEVDILRMLDDEYDDDGYGYSGFEVHGGVTYYAHGLEDIDDTLNWYGFDCRHSGDLPNYKQALEYGLITVDEYNDMIYMEIRDSKYNNVYRELDYVEKECKSMIDQIKG